MLILGFAGSVFAAVTLCISAEGILAETAAHPEAPALMETQPILTDSLSVAVPGTTLRIEKLSSYDGPFLEDRSDREVVNVAALHVHNADDKEILKACVTLWYGNVLYVFYGEHIPPGATVILLESNGMRYREEAVSHCNGWQETANYISREDISVTDRAMGTLIVTNLTDKTFQNVCLYYKSWLSPPEVYVGGITYETRLPLLLPGQSLYLYPDHYATGYSKVVSVTADCS